jgi:hypothetical protein
MQLFFSYARPDRPRVESLVTRLRQAGIDVWLDSDLVGGWPWWDKILGQLRSCDALVAAVSRASMDSEACRSEREYAAQLGKPILPIALEHLPAGLFPADIAQIQAIDYTQPDEAAALRLASAIFTLPKPKGLPNPLPKPPNPPQTRFGDLNELIRKPSLSHEEQLGILVRLEDALGPSSHPDDRETAAEMLIIMAQRTDLYADAARKIEALRVRPGGRKTRPRPQSSDPPPKSQAQNVKAPPPRRAATSPAAVSPHRGMAITTAIVTIPLIVFAPIGIAALMYSSRVNSKLAAGDTEGARQASSRVALIFWLTIAMWVVFIIIDIAVNAAHSKTGSSALMISSVVR